MNKFISVRAHLRCDSMQGGGGGGVGQDHVCAIFADSAL